MSAKNYAVIDTATGKLLETGYQCESALIALAESLPEGQQVIDGDGATPAHTHYSEERGFYRDDPRDNDKMRDIRRQRNYLLSQTDKYMVEDFPIDAETRQAWREYRLALRGVPGAFARDEEGFTWPEPPGVI